MGVGTPNMRNTTWNTLTTHVAPQWYNPGKAVDIISRGYPTLRYFLAKAEKKASTGESIAIRLLDSLNTAEAYSYYDSVSTAPIAGAKAGEVPWAMYAAPLAMSEQEELEFTSETAIADRMKELFVQTELGFGRRLCIDFFAGSITNSKRINGLEQIIFPANHSGYDGTTAIGVGTNSPGGNDWKYRQTTSTYAGITRIAFTAMDTAGTGWENLSVNWLDDTAGANRLDISSTAPYGPGGGLKNLIEIFNVAQYGLGGGPDILVCSPVAYNDYEFSVMTKQLVYRVPNAFTGADLTFEGLNFKNKLMIYDEWAKSYNVQGGVATANNPLIYGLNSNTLKFVVDKRKDFSVGATKEPYAQFAGCAQMQWRGQLICSSPRNQFVVFNYNVTV